MNPAGARTRALAIIVGAEALLAAAMFWLRPSGKAALECEPARVRMGNDGIARCDVGVPLPAAAALAVGAKLDLNRCSADELALIPGVGPSLAKTIVDARTARGGFKTWDELDSVAGVGPARLEVLQQAIEIR